MAHEIDQSNGRSSIAFVGQVPWHGLGQELTEGQPIEVWAKEAGMDWRIKVSPVLFRDLDSVGNVLNTGGEIETFPGRKLLFRSDTRFPLSIVSDDYKIVQPIEILEFFRDLVGTGGLSLNTAGCLRQGRKFWTLASIGESITLVGGDRVDGYLMLATSCDGSMSTTAMFTSIRVVCNNTLTFAVLEGETGKAKRYLRISHHTQFQPDVVKAQLGLAHASWLHYADEVKMLSERTVTDMEAMDWLIRVFGNPEKAVEEQPNPRVLKRVFNLYQGGMGSDLESARGTAWGLVNAATQYVDHAKGRVADTRLNSAWFGDGAVLKQKAWQEALWCFSN